MTTEQKIELWAMVSQELSAALGHLQNASDGASTAGEEEIAKAFQDEVKEIKEFIMVARSERLRLEGIGG